MNADGSGKVNLTKSPDRYEFSPSFYPSGRRIIFTAAPKGNLYVDTELYAISFDAAGNATGPPKKAHQQQVPGHLARRLRGRKKIAFVSARDENAENFGDQEIYVMNSASEGPNNKPVRLTDNTYNDESPDFSPNNRRIVYTGRASDNFEVMVMSATDGGEKRTLPLTTPLATLRLPSRPTGT